MTAPPSPAVLLVSEAGGKALSRGGLVGVSLAIVVLVVLAGFFAMAETALTRMSRVKVVALQEAGKRGANALSKVVNAPERYINPVLLLVLICHTLLATLVGKIVGPYGVVGFVVSYLIELVVIFVLAESGPKTFAVQRTEQAALLAAPAIVVVSNFPPVRLLTRGLIGLANVLFPGRGSPIGPSTSEHELLALASEAEQEEVIETEERELIHSIIEFGDTITREVMVARPDMVSIDARSSIDDALEILLLAGYSRMPVHNSSIDDIRGLIYLKDLVRASRDGKGDETVESLVRDAHIVPETKRVAVLMREMQLGQFHMAVVVDEYGGVAGIVTLEDLIEELVGEIVDEYDTEEPLLHALGDGAWSVAGTIPVDEINDKLNLGVPEDDDWDTLGGYLFHRLGHVPDIGEHVESNGHVFTVEKMGANRIDRIRIEVATSGEIVGA
ncbi:MAG: hemolysin family protein [Acidimicrobiales bacterium]